MNVKDHGDISKSFVGQLENHNPILCLIKNDPSLVMTVKNHSN